MRYRTLSNSPIERTVVTYSHVKWQNSFTTDELDKIVAYCDSVGTERAKVIGVDEDNIPEIEKKRKRDSEPIDLRASDDCDGVSFCG